MTEQDFMKLWTAWEKPIRKQLSRVLKSDAEVDDVTQEVAIRLWQYADRFTGDSIFSTWLHRVVYNEAMRYRRKFDHPVDQDEREVIDWDADPEVRALRIEDAAELRGLIASILTKRELAVFDLVLVQGRSRKETAFILDIPEGTVRSRLNSARKKLGLPVKEGSGEEPKEGALPETHVVSEVRI